MKTLPREGKRVTGSGQLEGRHGRAAAVVDEGEKLEGRVMLLG